MALQNSCGTAGARPARIFYFLPSRRCSAETPRDSSPQERIVIEKAEDREEAAAATAAATAIHPTASAVEHEQREKTEAPTSVGMPAATRKCDVDADVHDASQLVAPTADSPNRPVNSSSAKQEIKPADALNVASPVSSPISKQVGRIVANNFLDGCSIVSTGEGNR